MTKEASTPSPAEKYDQFFVPAMFGPWARLLLDYVRPRPGETMLDLACGTGVVARTLAPGLLPGGKVVGLDLRPGMLAAARALPANRGLPIEWKEGDAVNPDLPDAMFDGVVCQQGLQFFGDRPAAVRSMRRVLKDGGRVVINAWLPLESQSLFHAMALSEVRHLGHLGVTEEEVNAPFSLGSADALRDLLAQGGFRNISVEHRVLEARFTDPDRFVENVEYAYSAVVPELGENRDAFREFTEKVSEDVRDLIQSHRQGEEIVFPLHSHVARAEK